MALLWAGDVAGELTQTAFSGHRSSSVCCSSPPTATGALIASARPFNNTNLSGRFSPCMQIAKRQAVVNPENTFFSVKRFVGRRMSEVTEECKQVPYVVSVLSHVWQQGEDRGAGGA